MVMGSTVIHEDVFREIVRLLLDEMEEIYVYEPKGPLSPFLGEKAIKPIINIHRKKQVSIQDRAETEESTIQASDDLVTQPETQNDTQNEVQPELVEVEVKLALIYGASIPQTVAKIRQEIAERIQRFTGYKTDRVDVYITRIIRFENERSEINNESETTSDYQDEGSGQPTAGGEAGNCN